MKPTKRIGAVLWIIAVLMTVSLVPATAAAESLVWDASSGTVDGYVVYWGTRSNDRTNSRNVGNVTRYDLNNLPLTEGTPYYLCVSAYNTAGESQPCTPVVFTPGDNTPPLPPVGLTTE